MGCSSTRSARIAPRPRARWLRGAWAPWSPGRDRSAPCRTDRRRAASDRRVDRLVARSHRAHDVPRQTVRTRSRRGFADAAEPRRARQGRRHPRLILRATPSARRRQRRGHIGARAGLDDRLDHHVRRGQESRPQGRQEGLRGHQGLERNDRRRLTRTRQPTGESRDSSTSA